jgi:hypothetical protein
LQGGESKNLRTRNAADLLSVKIKGRDCMMIISLQDIGRSEASGAVNYWRNGMRWLRAMLHGVPKVREISTVDSKMICDISPIGSGNSSGWRIPR